MVKNPPAMWETQVQSLVEKLPWRREWQPTPTVLPGKFHGQRSPVGCDPWGLKQLDMTEHSCTHTNKTFQWVKELNIKRKYTQIFSNI